jgi:HEAT repeat protein
VPFLIEKLKTKGNPLQDVANSLYEKLPAPLQQHVPFMARSDMVRWRAAWALSWLGPDAKSAVPDLARLMSNPTTATMSMAWALRAIGPEASAAIPALHIALTNQDAHLHVDAAWAIWSIAKDTNLVIKVCTNAIITGRADIRAVWVLSDMGPAAMETMPLLMEILKDHNRSERLRSTAAFALGCSQARTPEIIAILVVGIDDEKPLVRMYSSVALWKIDSQHVPVVVPKIVEGIIALNGTQYQESKEGFVQFVEDNGLDLTACVPALNKLLESDLSNVKEAALNALQKIATKRDAKMKIE